MRYRIRKGLESPCMIRGLLSGDYWIFVGCCSAAFVLFFLGIRAGISAGNWNLPVLVLVISLPTLPLLLYKLKRKARPQKFKETGKEINISNLDINRVLTKRSIMKSEEAYSILDIVSESEGQGVVLTRSGSICVSFELREPECYSLTPEDIDRRDGMFREAFKFLPDAHMCTNRMCSSRKGTVRTLPAVLSLTGPMRGISGDDCMSAIPASCTLYFPDSKVLRRPTYPHPCPIRRTSIRRTSPGSMNSSRELTTPSASSGACVIRR